MRNAFVLLAIMLGLLCLQAAPALANAPLTGYVNTIQSNGLPGYSAPLPTLSGGIAKHSGLMLTPGASAFASENSSFSFDLNAGTLTNAAGTTGAFLNGASGSTIGNAAAWWTGTQLTRSGRQPDLQMVILTGSNSTDLSAGRTWAGLASSFSLYQYADPVSGSLATVAFGYDPAVDSNVHWYAITSTGSATTRTDTGVSITVSTLYNLRVFMPTSSKAVFYINGNPVATNTTNLPSTGSDLYVDISNTAEAATAVNIKSGGFVLFTY